MGSRSPIRKIFTYRPLFFAREHISGADRRENLHDMVELCPGQRWFLIATMSFL